MDFEEFMVMMVVLIPLACVCLGMTVRLVLKPLIETVVQAMRDVRGIPAPGQLQSQLLRLEEQIGDLTESVDRLESGLSFDRQLTGPGQE